MAYLSSNKCSCYSHPIFPPLPCLYEWGEKLSSHNQSGDYFNSVSRRRLNTSPVNYAHQPSSTVDWFDRYDSVRLHDGHTGKVFELFENDGRKWVRLYKYISQRNLHPKQICLPFGHNENHIVTVDVHEILEEFIVLCDSDHILNPSAHFQDIERQYFFYKTLYNSNTDTYCSPDEAFTITKNAGLVFSKSFHWLLMRSAGDDGRLTDITMTNSRVDEAEDLIWWPIQLKKALASFKVMLAQNLDPTMTTKEFQDVMEIILPNEIEACQIVPQMRRIPLPTGEGVVILKNMYASEVVAALKKSAIVIGEEERPVIFECAREFIKKDIGYLDTKIVADIKLHGTSNVADAVATAHITPDFSFEAEAALKWKHLQYKQEYQLQTLLKLQESDRESKHLSKCNMD